jgi:hypothetical protein
MARGARSAVKGASGPEAGKGKGETEVRGPQPTDAPAVEQELPPQPPQQQGKPGAAKPGVARPGAGRD